MTSRSIRRATCIRYWFGPGEKIVAVKDGELIGVKVDPIKGAWTDRDRADDVELAKLVVLRFG
jgi:hypothetical protein